MFASKEVEEEAKQEPLKTFTPGEMPNALEPAEEQQIPKVVGPSPEELIAIKVLFHCITVFVTLASQVFGCIGLHLFFV